VSTGAPLNRQQLYEAIWSEPVHTVAARYGISDVGLAKLCRRHGIPLPGRGYWQQVRAGQKMRRPPLPARAKTDPPDVRVILRPTARPSAPDQPDKPQRPPAPPIPVPESLINPHRLVAKTAKALRASQPDSKGFLHHSSAHCLDIRVTPAALERALLIMDTLLQALDKRGYRVTVGSEHPWVTTASVQDETIGFCIEERIKQVAHQATPIEELEAKQFSWHPRKYDSCPSGELRLRIANAKWHGLPETWADGKKGRLEQYLGEFVRGLEDVAAGMKAQRVQEEEAQIRREEERKQEWERQLQRHLDERRAAELEEQASRWREARDLREYVAALKNAKTVTMRTEYLEISSLQEWVAWAEAYAEGLDPTARQVQVDEPGHI
jgi:hypothetical protein